MPIILPKSFKDIIDSEPALRGSIEQIFQEFLPWIETSGLIFFPGYTDHGPTHINDVLKTCASIMSDDSIELLTPNDICVLAISVLLHDCAMHLTEDSFRSLVSNRQRPRIEGFHDEKWYVLWDEYLAEVGRWDERKLKAVTGESDPINIKKFNINNFTEKDRLIVGEFIRRHHPRIAHEIALYGVPIDISTPLKLLNISIEVADLGGLIARSHGMSMRSCYSYLSERYDLREFQGIHTLYVMVILRVADYVQVKSERAPKTLLKVKTLKSPISRGEWNAHHAIRDIRANHEDPEALYIDASPADVTTFLKLRNLFIDIQNELDTSWAVLGEVYGRFPPLNLLGLSIRRILSSIDDKKSFSKRINYIPEPCAFDAAGIELLKLLIGPLYGDTVEVGIRELIQNSIDACRELSDLVSNDEKMELDFYNQENDVLVVLHTDDNGNNWLEITDKGVGMTSSVIKDYFLRAGASFRNSQLWKKEHEDEAGKSKVLRGGRFGVGALAAFLLGNEINVTTRSFRSPREKGIEFSAQLEDEVIEMRYCDAPIGTKITIRIESEDILKRLEPHDYNLQNSDHTRKIKWNNIDWYFLEKPSLKVKYISGGNEYILNSEYELSGDGAILSLGWNRVYHQGYADIQWTYEDFPAVTCNGIKIVRSHSFTDYVYTDRFLISSLYLAFEWPNMSIFDPQGILPLNLQRDHLSLNQIEFKEQLSSDVAKDFIAWFLLYHPVGFNSVEKSVGRICSYPGLSIGFYRDDSRWWPLAFTKVGTTLACGHFLKELSIKWVYVLPNIGALTNLKIEDIPNDSAVVCYRYSYSDPDLLRFYRSGYGHGHYAEGLMKEVKTDLRRVVISEKDWKKVKAPKAVRRDMVENTTISSKENGKLIISNGSDTEKLQELKSFASIFSHNDKPWISQWRLLDSDDSDVEDEPLQKYWLQMLGEYLIPYDETLYSDKLKNSYDKLQDRIERHKKLGEEKEKLKETD